MPQKIFVTAKTRANTAHILRVFVNGRGEFGNPVGIVIDEKQEIGPKDRQRIAANLGFSESVFVNNLETGTVSIYNPQEEVNFAGHALVGTAYCIEKIIGRPLSFLACKVGRIQTWQEKNFSWIRANIAGMPPWHHEQLQDVSLVKNLSHPQIVSYAHTYVWAWLERGKNTVCARTFAPDWGIPEDEANGSGSMQLAVALGRKLEIHHGKGSVIYANPTGNGLADLGGRVKEDGFCGVF